MLLSGAPTIAYGPDTYVMSPLSAAPVTAASLKPASQPSHLVINPTFDSSITDDPHAAAIEAALKTMIGNFESEYTTPITVNVKFAEMSSGLAESLTFFTFETYPAYVKALAAHATSADDKAAVASLPGGTQNPVNGGTDIELTDANARALGFSANPSGGYDATIKLNMSLFNLSRFNINPNKYDLIASSTHEMDEVLGIGSTLDAYNNNVPIPTGWVDAEDLFRYNMQTGARSYNTNPSTDAGFSFNGGKTFLPPQFNQMKGDDFNDWYNPGGSRPPEVQDAEGTPGTTTNVGVELIVLDVLGYTLAPGITGGFRADLLPAAMPGWSSPLVVTTTKGGITDSTSITTSQTVYVDSAILNQGPADTFTSLKSDITLDGKVVQTFDDKAGITVNDFVYSIGLSLGQLAAGTHTLTITVNIGNNVPETDINNNTFTRTFTVSSGALPDLAPYTPPGWSSPLVVSTTPGVYTTATSITTSDLVYVDVAFINKGNAPVTSDITSTVSLNGVIETLVDYTPPLDPGFFYYYVNVGGVKLAAGNYTLVLKLNSNNAFAESSLSNNTYTTTFTVT